MQYSLRALFRQYAFTISAKVLNSNAASTRATRNNNIDNVSGQCRLHIMRSISAHKLCTDNAADNLQAFVEHIL